MGYPVGTLPGLCAANDLVPLLYKDVDHRGGPHSLADA